MYTEIIGLVLMLGLWVVSVIGITQLMCLSMFGIWPAGPMGWLVNRMALLNKGDLMSNLNIAKLVCEREGSHNMKVYKRDDNGTVLAKQCSRCGKIRWLVE